MVGTGRFELPTPRTPSECSTRLSHVPTRLSRPRTEPALGFFTKSTPAARNAGRRSHHPGPSHSPRGLLRRRHVLARQCRSGTEEELLHLLHQELLRLRRPWLQPVLVQQHLLALHPLAPRGFRHVLVNLLPELRVERRLVQAFHLALVANAKNHVRHAAKSLSLGSSIVKERA